MIHVRSPLIRSLFVHSVCRTIDKQIILGDVSLSQLHNASAQRSFTPLDFNEVIQEGLVVGIDCEFVTLNQVTAACLFGLVGFTSLFFI
jgi:hypothetical protein